MFTVKSLLFLRACKDLFLKLSTARHYRLQSAELSFNCPLSLPSSKTNSG